MLKVYIFFCGLRVLQCALLALAECEWETERASPYMSTYPVFNIQVNIIVEWASEVFS